MRYVFRLLILMVLSLGTALAVFAQEDDKSFLTRTLQDALSGAGRIVSIDGFRGALSSAASFDRMTISDGEGIWLTLEDVVLDWNRSALLGGRLEVESLTAQRLDLPRLPVAEGEALPDPEAAPFSLPDLPVSVELTEFEIAQINLGAPLLGEAAQLRIAASALFTDNEGDIDLTAERTDAKRGSFAIKANFERRDNILDLLLRLSEGKEGLAARLLNLPGLPSVDMNVAGSGPLDDFTTDMQISTDGAERLAGEVSLSAQSPRRASSTPDRRVQANIGGDITALLAPRFREFFGTDVRLTADAVLEANGAIDVSRFALEAQAAKLAGAVTLGVDKWPTLIDITGTVVNPDGTTILLPTGGDPTQVQAVDLRVEYDAGDGDAIQAAFDIAGLSVTGVQVEQTALDFNGTLRGDAGTLRTFAGDLVFAADGLALVDAALAEAIGSRITGRSQITYTQDQPIAISGLDLRARDFGLQGKAVISGIDTGLRTQLDAALEARDLSRFSALAGRELDGQTRLALRGQIVPLSGQFHLRAAGSTQDLALGIAQADAVLAGRTELSLAAKRDETGTFVRDLALENAALNLTGRAELRSGNSRAEAQFRLEDVSLVVPQYAGPVQVEALVIQDARGWRVDATTDGPYGAALTAKGLATGPNAQLDFTADVPDMKPFAEQVDGPVKATGTLRNTPQGWQVTTDATGPYRAQAAINGVVSPQIDLRFDMSVPDIEPIVPQLNGPLAAQGTLKQTADGFALKTQAGGPYDVKASVDGTVTPQVDVAFELSLPDVSPLAPQVSGPLAATGTLRQTADGFALNTTADGPYAAKAAVAGLIAPRVDVTFDLKLPNVSPLVPQASGPLGATGTLQQTDNGFVLATKADGPYAAKAAVQGLIAPKVDVTFDLNMPNVAPVVPQLNGPLAAKGTLRQNDKGFFIDTLANGPYGARAQVEGLATGPDMQMTFDLSVPNVAPLAPGVSGRLAAKGVLRQTLDGIAVDTNATGPYASRAAVQGVVTGANANVTFDVAIPNIGAVVDRINGPLDLQGTARKQGAAWRLDTGLRGPSGTQAQVSGLVRDNGTLGLDIAGTAPLGLSRPFLEPRDLQGLARFDLNVNGPPALSSVSGTVQTSDASLSAPNLRVALQNIAADIRLGSNRAQLDVTAQASNGGQIRAGGGVTLTGSLPADIQVGLENVVLIDPRLYKTTLAGALRIAGPLAGGAGISGQVNVGETVVNVPSTGLTSIGDIPPINHIGATRPVMSTRRKAGIQSQAEAVTQSGSSGPGYGLDVQVNAPNRIFVRGRGLDAELGGGLRVTGSTNRVISAGQFELLRGRLSILGQRFDLEEGRIQFQGDLVPFIYFVSATQSSTGEVRVIVEGPADAPEVSFESTPAAPQDEVLAQLLFGRSITDISPFQALQLANAVASLAGRGGVGIISNLREGIGLDDLDVTTTDSGATAVRAGKYISENVYTDVTAASDGDAEVSLNLDITDNLKGKATLGSDGNSGIGIFFEKDY